jgi:type II secretory pathway pseudopilin PulG
MTMNNLSQSTAKARLLAGSAGAAFTLIELMVVFYGGF